MNIFNWNNPFLIRKKIYKIALKKKILFNNRRNYTKSFYCVINPIDYCEVACPHCLYSTKNISKQAANKISINQWFKTWLFLWQAWVKQIVFSWWGEPFENTTAMLNIIKNTSSLEDIVIITSGYFAKSVESTKEVVDKIFKEINNHKNDIKLTFRISRDSSQEKQLPIDNIINIIDYKINNNKNLRIILRTIVNDDKDIKKIKDLLGAKLLPKEELPLINWVPVKWMLFDDSDIEIPIIYKPYYFVWRWNNSKKKTIIDVWDLVYYEEKKSWQFNLSIRWNRWEWHNYYEDLFFWYSNWKEKNWLSEYYKEFKYFHKQLALYITASWEITINNGVPDIYNYINEDISWQNFLDNQYIDIIQHELINNGPNRIKDLVSEVIPDIDKIIEENNFVFSVSYECLKTPALRLYLTLRLLNIYKKAWIIEIEDDYITSLESINKHDLKDMFITWNKEMISNISIDPIKGNEKRINE